MTDLRLVQCDSCETRVPVKEADGWFSVHELVTTPEHFEQLVRKAQEEGISGATSGDFCSLPCLSRWAANAHTLRGFENRPTVDPPTKPELPPANLEGWFKGMVGDINTEEGDNGEST